MAQRQFRSDDTDKWVYGFGSGKDGVYSSSGNATFSSAYASCSGTSGTKSLTLGAASTFSDGDLVLIHQTRGTNANKWELNKIVSGGGTTSITLKHDLCNTYTDSGDSQAQIVELKEYSSFTQNSGHTLSAPAWDGNVGGIIAYLVNGIASGAGTFSLSEKGFRGGAAGNTGDNTGYAGEGSGAASAQNVANPTGNGGGKSGVYSAGGGNAQTMSIDAAEGTSDGSADLTQLPLGGGGSGGSSGSSGNGIGGNGGGGLFMFCKQWAFTGSIVANGQAGANSGSQRAGAGGAGGSILIKAQKATLGSNLITATGGAKGTDGSNVNTAGSTGRIHLDYLSSYTGTTNPTLDVRQDAVLNTVTGGSFLFNFI